MMLLIVIMMSTLMLSMVKNYSHFMNVLMIFEFFILMLFFCLNFYNELLIIIMFCVFSVCESSLGLSMMIIMIRCSGSDYCSLKFLTC